MRKKRLTIICLLMVLIVALIGIGFASNRKKRVNNVYVVTYSRTLDSTYQNTYGCAILVSVSCCCNIEHWDVAYFTCQIGIVDPPTITVAQAGFIPSLSSNQTTCFSTVFTVPQDFYYGVKTCVGGNGGIRLDYWVETELGCQAGP